MIQSEFTDPVLAVNSVNLAKSICAIVEAAAVFALKPAVSLEDEAIARMQDGLRIKAVRNADSWLEKPVAGGEDGLPRVFGRVDQRCPAIDPLGHPRRL